MRVEAVRSGSSCFAAGAFFASFTESVEFWQDLIEVTTIVEFRSPADMFSDLRYS